MMQILFLYSAVYITITKTHLSLNILYGVMRAGMDFEKISITTKSLDQYRKTWYYIRKLGKGGMSMTNEEILIAAQRDQSDIGEAEKEVMRKEKDEERRILLQSMIVLVVACIIMIVVEWIVVRKIDFGKPALLLLFSGTSDLLEGKKKNKKKTLTIGVVEIIASVALVLLYIGALVA